MARVRNCIIALEKLHIPISESAINLSLEATSKLENIFDITSQEGKSLIMEKCEPLLQKDNSQVAHAVFMNDNNDFT